MSKMKTRPQEIEVQQEVVEERTKVESYWDKLWRRFNQNRLAQAGLIMVSAIILISIFAPFLSPYDYNSNNLDSVYIPPQEIHFIDQTGDFHLRPFVYQVKEGLDPDTWKRVYKEDKSKRYPINFLVRSWKYEFLGLFESDLHLFGIQGDKASIHLLGTDKLGRDLLSRIFYGSRISITVALLGALITVVVGSTIGAISGYYAGKVDMVIQRIIEIIRMFPRLALWMALSVAIPPTWPPLATFFGIIVVFAFINWVNLAREVRGKVLSYRETEFVLAAETLGASAPYIIFKHIIPNVISHIIVIGTITIPRLIIAESALSFLGLGIQPPLVSWGVLLSNATTIQTIGQHPWIIIPGVAILVTVLGFNFLGDGLRDAVDPYSD
ncbi:ABC-type dipeptide/oligopeptide/nickel transport system, permease component [Halobacteroides halobius DSM 5150]|uniref:ABC-type dipeptide/oligopeptide/nickel transport system, permease component n=1 Tax=Halobacteroides halobius (strain ATCC 35273 / DSM 5150 / MD-1) TaxID=748449 RepID=L0KCX4_HALHC|nr:ABC transporter permease [Halobacteroides halobius]AGB42390.1 ABC-type dipeptide/oligopeptide/nickel transport system, permease component [Halobacteroides halobius DSM 5150]